MDSELEDEIVTVVPHWYQRLLFWKDIDYTFHPVELQKDVHRIERFYHRQGFPDVTVDYEAKLDSTDNKLKIDFQIEEGDALLMQSVDFLGPDGRRAAHSLLKTQRKEWSYTRRENTTWRIGERLALPELVRVQTEMTTWLRDNGYAFSSIDIDLNVDSAAKLVDVELQVKPGPLTEIGDISIEWLDSEPLVDDHIVRRQLPFKTGDLYSLDALTRGQRGLFNLNVFRFARVDMPEQPVDSLVDVRVRLQRSDLNAIRAETGYGFEE
ncbi:MAG: POTRA domain-containing protein, partial [Candidatus Latescibacterota bacterium]